MLWDCVQSENMRRIDICSQVLDKYAGHRSFISHPRKAPKVGNVVRGGFPNHPRFERKCQPFNASYFWRRMGTRHTHCQPQPGIPLADCHHLTSFHFTSTCLPRMQMDIFVDLVDAWRNLEELTITPLPVSVETPTRRSDLSLDALILISMKPGTSNHVGNIGQPGTTNPQILGQLFVVGPCKRATSHR